MYSMEITVNNTCVCQSLSHVRLFKTPWTITRQAPLSMGFSKQDCWSGLPFHSPGDLPNPGIKPRSLKLQADSLPSEPPKKPIVNNTVLHIGNMLRRQILKVIITGKYLLCMMTDVNQTYYGDHFAIYATIKSLHCISETDIMLYVYYISVEKKLHLLPIMHWIKVPCPSIIQPLPPSSISSQCTLPQTPTIIKFTRFQLHEMLLIPLFLCSCLFPEPSSP